MTYILNTTDRPHTTIPAARIAARIATPAKQLLTATVHRLISLPSAIGAALFHDLRRPLPANRQHKDHSDPQNF